MKRFTLTVFSIVIFVTSSLCQLKENTDQGILFRGLIIDATTFAPISNSQITINREFSSVSRTDGSFSFYANRRDTVIFSSLGYKHTVMYVSDTLKGREFITGIYMNSDTVSIGEVIIMPGYKNLKSEILNAKTREPEGMENARYNVAVSAYQGKTSQSVLGDPALNYEVIRKQQKIDAFERGGIHSENIVGLSPLLLIPAAYLLMNGLPEPPSPMSPRISDREASLIHEKYLESVRKKK